MPPPAVLIVEDEAAQLRVLADEFADHGFIVFRAPNGEEGFQTAIREEPDIILLDLMMPGIDGMTVMKKLRAANAWGKKVPVMLLTNLIPEKDRMKKIRKENPAHYLVKSIWPLSEIVGKVKEQLSKHESN